MFDDRILQAAAQQRVGQRLIVGVGDEEHVFHALAEGGDLGVLQRQVELQEDAPDPGQQARAVRRGDLKDGHRPLGIVEDGHLGREIEVLELARYPALNDRRVVLGVAQRFGEAIANLLDPLRVVADRAAVVVEHDVGVEGELAA
ncbi:hypothetical protein D3C81_1757930 [compost metagenome]